MTTTEMNTLVNEDYAKTSDAEYSVAAKLRQYVIADGILNGLIIQQQEDRGESEPAAVTTVAGQNAYAAPSRNHHINWLKISYDGTNFIPARYVNESELILWFGNEYQSILSAWSAAYPIYFTKGGSFHVYLAATASQAGVGRLKYSVENLPAELTSGGTPTLVPPSFHYLHAAYAAMNFLDVDDPLYAKAKRLWDEGAGYPDGRGGWVWGLMLYSIYPNAREREIISRVIEEEDDWAFDSFGLVSNGASNVNYVDNETPAGTINGVNAVFTLAHAPSPSDSLLLFLNGQLLEQVTDYTLSGSTITFVTPPDILFASLPFSAFYRY